MILTDEDVSNLPAAYFRSNARALISNHPPLFWYGDDMGDGRGRSFFKDTWNAAIYEPLQSVVSQTDVHCSKNRYSGLWNQEQPLFKYLTESGKKTLLFAGVMTDRCVLGTLTDAASWGWDCAVIDDCVATTTEIATQICLANIEVRKYHTLKSFDVLSNECLWLITVRSF
jgi:nicotinamidase-related amidase